MRCSLVAVVVAAVLAPLTVGACTDRAAVEVADVAATPSTPATPLTLAITPAAGGTELPISTEIGIRVGGGTVSSVTLRDADGGAVPGRLRDDGSAWVPSKPLKTRQRYAATVVATGAGGQATTATTSFITMGTPPRRTGTGLYLFDHQTYGVAMPVVVEFNPGIRKADRAGVQKRMFVRTDPPQAGVWSWTASGTQAFYRGPEFWRSGTTLAVRIALGGLPTGGGRYGDRDRSATATIGRDLRMAVDNATKTMTVRRSGQVVRTMPVSLGKPSTPSSSAPWW